MYFETCLSAFLTEVNLGGLQRSPQVQGVSSVENVVCHAQCWMKATHSQAQQLEKHTKWDRKQPVTVTGLFIFRFSEFSIEFGVFEKLNQFHNEISDFAQFHRVKDKTDNWLKEKDDLLQNFR